MVEGCWSSKGNNTVGKGKCKKGKGKGTDKGNKGKRSGAVEFVDEVIVNEDLNRKCVIEGSEGDTTRRVRGTYEMDFAVEPFVTALRLLSK